MKVRRIALALAGVLFVVYPTVRPYTDEAALEGARAFASSEWVAAHVAAMVAFSLLCVAFLHWWIEDWLAGGAGRARTAALVAGGAGVALLLPYYGAETFGLRVIGEEAVRTGDAGLLDLAEDFRTGVVASTMFGLGLVLLAAAGVATAVATWRERATLRWLGVPFAIGLALVLPQFFAPGAVRIAHGVLLGAGCLLLAWAPGSPRLHGTGHPGGTKEG